MFSKWNECNREYAYFTSPAIKRNALDVIFLVCPRYLIDHGANVSAVNNDGELAIDIAESDEMEILLQKEIDARGIDCDEARNTEERLMLEDARQWLNAKQFKDTPHPKTGATALHVAAAKGYIKVMRWVEF